jgi:hypothetical protein
VTDVPSRRSAQADVLKEDPIEPMLLFISNNSIKVDDKRKLNSFIALNVICTNIKNECSKSIRYMSQTCN